LACDAAKVEMRHARDGTILDVGRRTRTIPPALRRALEHRDAGCRFPGCGLKLCDAHHVEHWADGGATKLDNLIQLCRRHHRAVHEEGFTVELLPGGEVRFRRPTGLVIEEAPALPRITGDAPAALARRLARQGGSRRRRGEPAELERGPGRPRLGGSVDARVGRQGRLRGDESRLRTCFRRRHRPTPRVTTGKDCHSDRRDGRSEHFRSVFLPVRPFAAPRNEKNRQEVAV
jgi:hypothetical protein